jgi:hypothetical protein
MGPIFVPNFIPEGYTVLVNAGRALTLLNILILTLCYGIINYSQTCVKDHLQTKTTCKQRPPVNKDHLQTKTTCKQRPPANKDHLQTKTTCKQRPPANKDHL